MRSPISRRLSFLQFLLAIGLGALITKGDARGDSVVVFNEIQYHPAALAAPEWIELHNQMAVEVDLSHWKIRGGIDIDFPNGTVIPAGGYLLVSGDPGGMGMAGVEGPWTGSLSNGGETLRLRNNSNRLMDEITYGDRGVWPVGADGSGATLSKIDPDSASAEARNWRASAEVGGTPGARNFSSEATVGPESTVIPIDATWRYNESGADLGANWAGSAHAVDNVDWFSGPGLLGFETTPASLPEAIQTPFDPPSGNSIITYYFEIDFELTASEAENIENLRMRHVIDDGAVFYLNGVEAGPRFNMNAGAVTASTTTSASVPNAAYQGPFDLPTGSLVAGTNRLSVELHQQAATSSDVVFGLELSGAQLISPAEEVPLVISEIAGTVDPTFQVEIANAGNSMIDAGGYVLSSRGTVDADYTIPAATMITAGGFLVIDENELAFRPTNDDRLFLFSPGSSFLLDAARADDLPRARSKNHGGKMLVPNAATFGATNSFSINSDIVINEIMYHFRPDPGTQGTGQLVDTLELIPIDAIWRYNESGADLGANWEDAAHPVDNVEWFSGQALLGSETTPAALPEPLLTNLAPGNTNSIVTYYFETDFSLTAEQLANLERLDLRHVIDDGAAFYINGTEVLRFNLPAGAINASTAASPGVPNATYVGPVTLPTGSLVAGLNRLSVEVHQQFPTSSDVVFGAELSVVTLVDPGTSPQPIVERDEEWIELLNKGPVPVDLTGWSIDGGIDFDFPDGTIIAPGGYLVIAEDAAALASKHPGIAANIVGNYSSKLNNSSDTIRLEDVAENPVDDLRYYDGGHWPELADGDGSSIELRDPHADNANGDAWAASDESDEATWQTITYRDNGGQSYGLTVWNEFRLGMLRAGEVLIDDVSVVRDPDGVAQQLIQNGSFSTGANSWRLLGNHRHSGVISEPGNPGNNVLRLVATGSTDTRHNHLETTFAGNTALSTGQTYEVSFRARWVAGSNQINSRCYYQRLARTTQLERPENCGTPGAVNSRAENNIGPTFQNLRHSPPVPSASQFITVTADVADPDGLDNLVLKARVNEGVELSFPFNVDADGKGEGTLPGQSSGSVIQFWIEATDALGAASTAPAAGPDSHALIQVADGQGTNLAVQELRVIMLDSERDFMLSTLNLMSNERLGGTVIYNQRGIFYDVGVRPRGSGAGRARDGTAYRGFNIAYNSDQLFRGVQSSTSIDRSGRSPVARQQHEIFVKHMFNHAGIPCMYDDLIYFIGPSPTYTGPSQMQMAGYGGMFVETQFDNGGNGGVFNVDITYDPVTTTDGNPESFKPPVPFQHIGRDFEDSGDSEEDYRTTFEIRTGRRRDDYSGLIRFCQTIDLPTAELENQIGEVMDVDEWCRYTAMTLLCGIGDTYVNGGLKHNIRVFVPEDGIGVAGLPWDMDFVFNSSTTSSMLPSGNQLSRVIAIPKYRRLYWGHVQDIVNTTFNTGYMNNWLTHYGGILNQNHIAQSGYISARGSHAISQIPANVPFSVTTNGGGNFSVNDTVATLEGQGWINIREFRLAGSGEILDAEWLDGDTWRVSVPLLSGPNAITLETYDFQGNPLDTHAVTITSTVINPTPPEFLRITELHYNPGPPTTPAEIAVSSDNDEFEFVEFQNIGTETLDAGGVTFTNGITFTFPGGTMIPAGGYVVAVRNPAAFEARYGVGLPIIGEYPTSNFRNSGESLELRDSSGNIIHQFTYGDSDWYPATDGLGYSLHIRDATNPAPGSWGVREAWGISGDLHGNPGAPNSGFSTDHRSWQQENFTEAELLDGSISGPLANPAGDGITNLMKYAFGLDPKTPTPLASTTDAALVNNRLQVSFSRITNAADLEITAEVSESMALWTWTPLTNQVGVAIDNGDGTEILTFEDSMDVNSSPRRFVRVRVILLAP